ncbi:LOW QUALITY PROTEIN: hypothetical protein PHMEG_0005721 [Phytophthora megakarya]|uniref:Uncharacterized protein n=1 Tax=Phytophthora megakarya TaxID=4795 RepID=A0A225WQN4_9STRA|nr:LOW QUALITY PROTEIN: hypothetical protein PHMEG_0005721 [Phytophthora megakarya]
MILFKKGLKSTKPLELLQVREFYTFEDLLDGPRGLNPKDTDFDAVKASSRPTKKTATASPELKPRGKGPRCSATRCLETGHTAEKCWGLHPELKPQWLLNRERAGYNAATATAGIDTSGVDQKLWDVLSAIQSDLFKLVGPGDGIPRPDPANDHLVWWVFDPGKAADSGQYIVKDVGCVGTNPILHGSAFVYEGTDYCGVCEAFLQRNGLLPRVIVDFQVTFGNGQSKSILNRTISLSLFVDEMPAFDFEFNVCFIPKECDFMMGVPWKRKMKPIID